MLLLFPALPIEEMGKVQSICQSVCQSVLAHSSMMSGYIFFVLGTMIRYHGTLMHVKSNLALWSTWVIMAICLYYLSVCCDIWEECDDFVHICNSYKVWCIVHACKITICFVPNLSSYDNFFVNFVYLLWYLREEWVDFIHILYSNQIHMLLMHVKYNLELCQIHVIMPIFVFNFIFVAISQERMR